MNTRLLLASLVAGAAVLACTDGTAPLTEPPPALQPSPHFVKWDTANGPVRFSAVGETPYGALDIFHPVMRAAADSLVLDTYELSFWAVRGQEREVYIKYDAGDSWQTYIEFEVTRPIQRPDGSTIAWGDSVLITLTVDPVDLKVHLEPSGLLFDSSVPTELEFHYEGANPDFNEDGVVDGADTYIEENLLGAWYQEDTDSPWGIMDSVHRLNRKEFELFLEHFSGYAISW